MDLEAATLSVVLLLTCNFFCAYSMHRNLKSPSALAKRSHSQNPLLERPRLPVELDLRTKWRGGGTGRSVLSLCMRKGRLPQSLEGSQISHNPPLLFSHDSSELWGLVCSDRKVTRRKGFTPDHDRQFYVRTAPSWERNYFKWVRSHNW